MHKKKINAMDYAGEILKALPKGILLTTKTDEKVNSMVIGWGTIGVNWSKPVFAAYVRKHRFTKEQLEKNPEFTINVPVGDYDKKIIGICGGKSGRNIDKVAEAGLTLVEGGQVDVPAIAQFPMTLECRVIYAQAQDKSVLGDAILKDFYPEDVEGLAVGANRDEHITYFGEIVDAYILED